MRIPIRGRVRWAALMTIVGALAVGGVAYATIPDQKGIIHSCYKSGSGALRVIDDSAPGDCDRNETPLLWDGLPAVRHARVTDLGSVIVGSHGVTNPATQISTGVYNVQFDTDVTICTPVATRMGGYESGASIFAQNEGGDTVQVLTTIDGVLTNRPFSIALFC